MIVASGELELLPDGCKACEDIWGSTATLLLQVSPSRAVLFQIFINVGHDKQSKIMKLTDHAERQLPVQCSNNFPNKKIQL